MEPEDFHRLADDGCPHHEHSGVDFRIDDQQNILSVEELYARYPPPPSLSEEEKDEVDRLILSNYADCVKV